MECRIPKTHTEEFGSFQAKPAEFCIVHLRFFVSNDTTHAKIGMTEC